jgi:hypothetical protein
MKVVVNSSMNASIELTKSKSSSIKISTTNNAIAKLTGVQKSAVTVGIQGPAGVSSGFFLSDVSDIDTTGLEDGFVLVYDAVRQKWVAQRMLNKQQIDSGEESY